MDALAKRCGLTRILVGRWWWWLLLPAYAYDPSGPIGLTAAILLAICQGVSILLRPRGPKPPLPTPGEANARVAVGNDVAAVK